MNETEWNIMIIIAYLFFFFFLQGNCGWLILRIFSCHTPCVCMCECVCVCKEHFIWFAHLERHSTKFLQGISLSYLLDRASMRVCVCVVGVGNATHRKEIAEIAKGRVKMYGRKRKREVRGAPRCCFLPSFPFCIQFQESSGLELIESRGIEQEQ